jgi:hypothetical protein
MTERQGLRGHAAVAAATESDSFRSWHVDAASQRVVIATYRHPGDPKAGLNRSSRCALVATRCEQAPQRRSLALFYHRILSLRMRAI